MRPNDLVHFPSGRKKLIHQREEFIYCLHRSNWLIVHSANRIECTKHVMCLKAVTLQINFFEDHSKQRKEVYNLTNTLHTPVFLLVGWREQQPYSRS